MLAYFKRVQAPCSRVSTRLLVYALWSKREADLLFHFRW